MTLRNLLRAFKRGERSFEGVTPKLVVVGLGNPGPRYRNTRHNVAWWCIDELERRIGAKCARANSDTELAEGYLENEPVAIAKPTTFVNLSGKAVLYLARRYSVPPEQLLVVVDDMDIAPGKIRLRRGGSPGGHNGLKSITQSLGSRDFPRLRIGIGRPPQRGAEIDYVLATLPPAEREAVEDAVLRAADAVISILRDGLEAAMGRYN